MLDATRVLLLCPCPLLSLPCACAVGPRGPILLEDYHLVEKLAQFDRERIPERVVHARGAVAKGFFEVRQERDLTPGGLPGAHGRVPHHTARATSVLDAPQVTHDVSGLTCADFLRAPGVQTPVLVRFSTVVHERGSPETLRDPRCVLHAPPLHRHARLTQAGMSSTRRHLVLLCCRGFAVKFYTREGNFDMVGNNMPVFFIRDGMKFPDMVHAFKPNPKSGQQEAWRIMDFLSHHPEACHMVRRGTRQASRSFARWSAAGRRWCVCPLCAPGGRCGRS